MEPSKSVMRPTLPDTTKIQKYIFENGRFYEDAFFKKISFELLNGYKYNNGDIYKGTIKNGEIFGKFKTKTYVYFGSFKSWTPDGYGETKIKDYGRYAGEFKQGDYNGRGTYTYIEGSFFEGTVKNGEFLSGTFKFCDGSLYNGSFSNGNFEGLGIMLYRSGNSYEGMWKSHKRHGWGQMIYRENGKDVRTYEGFWEDDKECDSKMHCEKLA